MKTTKKELTKMGLKEDKKEDNSTINNQKILYECTKIEYQRECDREKIIENKAQIFIGLLVTFIALIVQKIPFKTISVLYNSDNNWIQYSIILTVFVIVIPVFIILLKLVSIINVKQHWRFAIKELKNKKLLEISEEKLYDALIEHYHEILENEERQNEELAKKLKNAIIAANCIVVILVVAIIILNIIFGGKVNV